MVGLVALEVAGLGGALLLYRAMDRSRGAAGRPGGVPQEPGIALHHGRVYSARVWVFGGKDQRKLPDAGTGSCALS